MSINAEETVTLDLDNLLDMKKEFDEKYPASKRAVRVKMSEATRRAMVEESTAITQWPPAGLPIEIDELLPFPSYCIQMADGSMVLCDSRGGRHLSFGEVSVPNWPVRFENMELPRRFGVVS